MAYTKAELAQITGLTASTIRNYVQRGIIPRPVGHGLAALYSNDAMLRAVAIARMRKQGTSIGPAGDLVRGWTHAQVRKFVNKTEPDAEPGAAPEPAEPAPIELGEAPAKRPRSLPEAIEEAEPIGNMALPVGRSIRALPLIPGLTLLLDGSAAPVVQRVAAEICAHYGQGF